MSLFVVGRNLGDDSPGAARGRYFIKFQIISACGEYPFSRVCRSSPVHAHDCNIHVHRISIPAQVQGQKIGVAYFAHGYLFCLIDRAVLVGKVLKKGLVIIFASRAGVTPERPLMGAHRTLQPAFALFFTHEPCNFRK